MDFDECYLSPTQAKRLFRYVLPLLPNQPFVREALRIAAKNIEWPAYEDAPEDTWGFHHVVSTVDDDGNPQAYWFDGEKLRQVVFDVDGWGYYLDQMCREVTVSVLYLRPEDQELLESR